MAKPLAKKTFHEALVFLKDRDGDLASILMTLGHPLCGTMRRVFHF
jgi:hypothetical protein